MTGTGGGLGGFLGAAAGEMLSPHGIMSSFIPVSRMPTAIVDATIAGFARNVAKEALFQGGTQGAAQALGTLVDYQTRKEFGTEQTTEQIIEEILSAAGGGAILGGAFRATHLGILKLASRGVEIPPAVLDAARVQEGADLYGNKNPLRVQPAAHETAADQATGGGDGRPGGVARCRGQADPDAARGGAAARARADAALRRGSGGARPGSGRTGAGRRDHRQAQGEGRRRRCRHRRRRAADPGKRRAARPAGPHGARDPRRRGGPGRGAGRGAADRDRPSRRACASNCRPPTSNCAT